MEVIVARKSQYYSDRTIALRALWKSSMRLRYVEIEPNPTGDGVFPVHVGVVSTLFTQPISKLVMAQWYYTPHSVSLTHNLYA